MIPLILALSSAADAAPVTYALDPVRSEMIVLVYKDPDTLASGLSHNHVMRAASSTGTITWDEANVGACKISISIPVAQLAVDEDAQRQKLGYELALSESQKADVKKNMLSKDQLDGATHPNITFESSSCTQSGATVTVVGNLTIKGKAKQVAVPMTMLVDDESLAASGAFSAAHTDFGFQPYTALMGQLKNKNELSFRLKIKAKAKT
jgi:polyisoprenoid-binding protein YceI